MTDVFFAKVSTVREQFSQQVEITEFPKDSPFCEAYLTKRVLNCIPNIYWIHYNHRTRKDTELGFFHMPYKGEENWKGIGTRITIQSFLMLTYNIRPVVR